MRQRIGLRQSAWTTACGLAAVLCCTCQVRNDRDSSRGAAPDWSANQPLQVVDGSLPDDEYVALGLPTIDRNWTGEDTKHAAPLLEGITKRHPEQLPRFGSARSGRVFSRITSSENLVALRNQAVPLSIRLPATIEIMQGLDRVFLLYLAAMHERHVTGDDLVELNGARLKTCQLMLDLLDEYLQTLPSSDPSHRARLASLEEIRSSLGEVLLGILRSLSEPQYFGLTARRKLLAYSTDTFPSIVKRLDVDGRKALLAKLDSSATDPHLANLQPTLREFRDRVASAVSRSAQ